MMVELVRMGKFRGKRKREGGEGRRIWERGGRRGGGEGKEMGRREREGRGRRGLRGGGGGRREV